MKILSALAIAGLALAANAQKHLQLTGPGQLVKPIAAAKAKVTVRNGNVIGLSLGQWHKYNENMQRPAASTTIAFDGCEFTFDADPNNTAPADGLYGRDCSTLGLGLAYGSRWFFGTTYVNGGRLDDMKLAPGAAGKKADRMMFAWYNAAATNDNGTLVLSLENFPTGAGGNGIDPNTETANALDGVLFTFGALGAGGYYFADIDMVPFAIDIQLPMDGDGAYLIAHGDYDGTNLIVGMCQNMLWGPGQPTNPSGPGNGLIWDDDTPLDAAFTDPDELFDYTFGICPDPIGGMLSLLYTGGGATTETLAPTTGSVNIGKSNTGGFGDTGAADGVSWRICKFVVTSATSPIVRATFLYTTTKTTPTAIDYVVTAKMVHSGTFKIQLLLSKDPNNPNNNAGYDVVLPQTAINTTMATYTGSAVNTPLTQYVGTGGQMAGRVEIYRSFSAVAAPCVDIDAALMKVTG
ncbi:MAG: hypothetical protein JST30_10740 [Armatimonadetes bacterium]|nr:hypothetical protein [Armatimonadota bacterium]